LTLTANTDIVVEASSHEIGGAKDWGSGSGSAAAGALSYWGRMDVKDVVPPFNLKLRLTDTPGPHGLVLPNTPW
ncbi:hypothetical protein, partial [Roseateles koreensis]